MKKREEIQPKTTAEDLAKKLGVSLAATPAPTAAPAAAKPGGFLAGPMPVAAAAMADLKEALGPELWRDVLENLKKGRGYVVDLTTMIAIGNPPADRFERGRVEERNGFQIMRVRAKA